MHMREPVQVKRCYTMTDGSHLYVTASFCSEMPVDGGRIDDCWQGQLFDLLDPILLIERIFKLICTSSRILLPFTHFGVLQI